MYRDRLSATCSWAFMLVIALSLPAAVHGGLTSEPLAEVDGQVITSDEVEKALGAPLARLQEQIYALKRQKVEVLIAELLLAREVDEGTRAGVTGTPAFFINGRMVSGAQPLESFARLIEDELARAR